MARNHNPELAAAAHDADAARARWSSTKAARLPNLSAEGSYFHSLDDQRLIQARSPTDPASFDADLDRGDLVVRMPVFTGGRLHNEMKAAELWSQASRHEPARPGEELEFNAASVFYSILAWQKAIAALEFSKEAPTEHRRRVESLIAAQKAAQVDLLRTEVRLADVEQNLVSARNTLSVQQRVLANLLGVGSESQPFTLVGELHFTEAAIDTTGSLAQAMAARPDYLAARNGLEAQARRVDSARAGWSPVVAVFGSYGARANGRSDSVDVGLAGVAVFVPLFEGGLTRSKVSDERSRLAAVQERIRKLELQIQLEVETAASDIESSSQRIKTTGQAISQARESLRIEREKYDLGKASITDVLDAQSALLQAETNYYRALADHAIARARLQLAEGGNL